MLFKAAICISNRFCLLLLRWTPTGTRLALIGVRQTLMVHSSLPNVCGFAFFSIKSPSKTVRFPFHLDLLCDPLRIKEAGLHQQCLRSSADAPRNP